MLLWAAPFVYPRIYCHAIPKWRKLPAVTHRPHHAPKRTFYLRPLVPEPLAQLWSPSSFLCKHHQMWAVQQIPPKHRSAWLNIRQDKILSTVVLTVTTTPTTPGTSPALSAFASWNGVVNSKLPGLLTSKGKRCVPVCERVLCQT